MSVCSRLLWRLPLRRAPRPTLSAVLPRPLQPVLSLSRGVTSSSTTPPSNSATPISARTITQTSLSEALPLATPTGTVLPKIDTESCYVTSQGRQTTLSNGLRVVTEARPAGQYCTVGVCIESGSRFEVAFPAGISHLLEKLAFGSTQKFASKDDMMTLLEQYGGICDCQTTRDTVLYASSVDRRGLDPALEVLADAVLRPRLLDEELEFARTAVQFDLEEAQLRPDQEPLMHEAVHAAAYANNTLGLPKLCPEKNLPLINRDVVLKYLSAYHAPDRTVLAGVGVDHDEFVRLAQKYFVDEPPVWGEASARSAEALRDHSLAQYTGGLVTIERDLSNASLGPTPLPDLAHLTIGLESVSHQHEDFIAFCVLNMLLGGGGSFSAGGPGKGMYSRMYLNVLNRHHWMYACQAFNHAYADTGVFCITGSAPPTHLRKLTEVIVHQLAILTGQIGEQEFARAKKQLQSMLLMNLESRPIVFEDIARQVLAQGNRRSPQFFIDEIAKVEAKDINRIAEKMLSSKPTVAAIGNLENLPDYRTIELGLTNRKMNKSGFELFKQ